MFEQQTHTQIEGTPARIPDQTEIHEELEDLKAEGALSNIIEMVQYLTKRGFEHEEINKILFAS